ncbi:SMI1/KNR4 family protein [Streptosporangium sp. NPDC051022]|uniref:SMI1/KNR4 family protein n=1 Tax=Streptosporangium sp. NPDC051022 TaxID=3155752 RepID=UPI00341DED14
MPAAPHDEFPPALTAIAQIDFSHGTIDYDPRDAFLSPEETASWIRAWTGNDDLSGDDFRVFGQDGTGGYTAFWLVRPGAPLPDQPVVFLGSEGEIAVVARNLADYLWLLANGIGPSEVANHSEYPARPNPTLLPLAERFAPGRDRSPAAVITAAAEEFPDFEQTINDLCRY